MTIGSFTLGEIANRLAVECQGDSSIVISGLATLAGAGKAHLSFLSNPKYKQSLTTTQAAAVILSPDVAAEFQGNCLVSQDPYLTYAKASQLFDPLTTASGIHSSAVIADTATIGEAVAIGAGCVIGEGAIIGSHSSIGAGTVIGSESILGEHCLVHANVTIYHGVKIGNAAVIQSGAVIGSDGFGYAPDPDGETKWAKIAQLGGVSIGDHVEIGACTTIDRGALDDTVIEDGVILDNHIQVAHNVHIGENTAIAAYTGIAGSARIGKNCTLAGRASIVGHITIADNTHVAMGGDITKSIKQAGSFSSGTGMQPTQQWRKNVVRFSQLDDMAKRLAAVEKKLDE